MSVTPSTLTPIENAAGQDDLWALAVFLKANWKEPVTLRTGFSTDVSSAQSESEQRWGLLGKPVRLATYRLNSLSLSELGQLQTALMRMGIARSLFPLACDETNSTNSTSGNTVNCDTKYRRLFVGARVVVVNNQTGDFVVRAITAKTDGSLTFSTTLGATFPIDSSIIPLIEAKVSLSQKIRIITDRVVEVDIEGAELPGVWALDPIAEPNSVPAGFDTYNGYPILCLPIDYSKTIDTSFDRTGDYSAQGITQTLTTYGTRPRIGRSLPYTFQSRAAAWKLIELFESRVGRLFCFFSVAPTHDYELVEFTGDGIRVKAFGPERDWTTRPYICIVRTDGSSQVRTVLSVSRSTGIDTLVLDDPFTSTGTLDYLTSAQLCRFGSDELAERWITNEVCDIAATILEVVEEKEKTIPGLTEATGGGLLAPFVPTLDGGNSGVQVPMFYWPCPAPKERPAGRAADLILPSEMQLRIRSGWLVDTNFPLESGTISTALLAALVDDYKLEYFDSDDDAQSHHWHHIRVQFNDPGLIFRHDGDTMVIKRRRWKAEKTYLVGEDEHLIEIFFVAEWTIDLEKGLWGVAFNLYGFASEVNVNYVDGEEFASSEDYEFLKTDPAICGVFVDGNYAHKFGHPKLLFAAAIPTSWTAPCGNAGYSCDESDIQAGFSACRDILNGAPWVEGDADICPNNVVFGSNIGGYNGAAMTLGGNCPTSSILPHLIIENKQGLGISALKPTASGWNEATGTLNVGAGSLLELTACLPSQSTVRIDCCVSNPEAKFATSGGSPTCWRPPDEAPLPCNKEEGVTEGDRCCFSTDSVARVQVTQKCVCQDISAGEDLGAECADLIAACPLSVPYICKTKSKTYDLPVCDAIYVEGGNQSLRAMYWTLYLDDPDYAYQTFEDDFDGVDSLTWNSPDGDWSFTSGEATVTTAPGATAAPQYATLENFTDYQDCNVEVDLLDAIEQGISMGGGSSDTTNAYIATHNQDTDQCSLYSSDGTTRTLILQIEVATSAVRRLGFRRKGDTLTVSINGLPRITHKTCSFNYRGRVGLVGYGNGTDPVRFDDFSIVDNDVAARNVRVQIKYGANGFEWEVPDKAMPLYPYDQNQCVNGPPCGTPPDCNCTSVTKTPTPADVFGSQPNASVTYAGGPKPYEGNGGPGCGNVCVGCEDEDENPCSPFADFVCLSVRILGSCREMTCPPNATETCTGFDVWYGQCVSEA